MKDMKEFKRKYGLALKVAAIVAVLAGIKLILHYNGIEYITMSNLFTTIIGGSIFLLGFILAGTMTDYKESEKMPSEIAASLENIYQEGLYIKKIKPEFNINAHNKRLFDIVSLFRKDLEKSSKTKKSIEAVSKLSDSMIEMEKIGAPAGYISRIKSEQGNMNKNMLRSFQIKDTSFIPAAYAIVEIMAFVMTVFFLFLKLDPFIELLVPLAIVVYIFVYMLLFIKDIDDPFEGDGGYGDVDMFLLHEFEKKVRK